VPAGIAAVAAENGGTSLKENIAAKAVPFF